MAWLASGCLPAGGRLAVGSLAAGGWLARGWRLAVGSLALAGAGWCLEIGPLVRWQIRGRDRRGNERLRRETPGKPQGHPEKTPAPQTHRCLLYSRSMPSLQPVDVFFLCIIRRGPQAGHPRDPIRRDTLGTPQGLPEKTPAPHRCLLYSRSMPPLQPGDVFFCASFEEAPQAGHPRDPIRRDTLGTPQGLPEKTPAPSDASFTAASFTAGRCLLYSRAMSFFLCIIRRGPSGGTPQGHHPRDTPGTPQGPPEKTPAPHRCLLYSRAMPPLQPGDASFTAGRCLFLCIIRRGPSGGAPQGHHPRDITPGKPSGTPGENAGASPMPPLQPGDVFFFPSLYNASTGS